MLLTKSYRIFFFHSQYWTFTKKPRYDFSYYPFVQMNSYWHQVLFHFYRTHYCVCVCVCVRVCVGGGGVILTPCWFSLRIKNSSSIQQHFIKDIRVKFVISNSSQSPDIAQNSDWGISDFQISGPPLIN